jgi:hypothetical protein
MISYLKEKFQNVIFFCKKIFINQLYYDIEKAEYVQDDNIKKS